MTLYDIKPRFQALLRPLVGRLAALGATANAVTTAALAGSLAVGAGVAFAAERRAVFLALPVWLFVRMALNAIDGMLAREHGQKSNLGAFQNELADVASDAALLLPFACVPHFRGLEVAIVAVLAGLTELAGVVAVTIGASRRYDGPLGKSDRAFVFGALGLALGFGLPPSAPLRAVFPLVGVLLSWTVLRRVRSALVEVRG